MCLTSQHLTYRIVCSAQVGNKATVMGLYMPCIARYSLCQISEPSWKNVPDSCSCRKTFFVLIGKISSATTTSGCYDLYLPLAKKASFEPCISKHATLLDEHMKKNVPSVGAFFACHADTTCISRPCTSTEVEKCGITRSIPVCLTLELRKQDWNILCPLVRQRTAFRLLQSSTCWQHVCSI